MRGAGRRPRSRTLRLLETARNCSLPSRPTGAFFFFFSPEIHKLILKCTRKCKESIEKVGLWSPGVGRGGMLRNGFGGFGEVMKMS